MVLAYVAETLQTVATAMLDPPKVHYFCSDSTFKSLSNIGFSMGFYS